MTSTMELAQCSVAMSGGGFADLCVVSAILDLCERVGQLERISVDGKDFGAVAWLRGAYEDIPTFRQAKPRLLELLPVERLTTGPVIYVAEVVVTSPRLAYNAVRKLKKLPGVEYWCGWRDRIRWAEGKVRHGRIS